MKNLLNLIVDENSKVDGFYDLSEDSANMESDSSQTSEVMIVDYPKSKFDGKAKVALVKRLLDFLINRVDSL